MTYASLTPDPPPCKPVRVRRRYGTEPTPRVVVNNPRAGRVENMRFICASVAWERNIDLADMMGPRRWRPWVHARQEAMWQMRQERYASGAHRYSFPEIGRYFGMDHATIIHGVKRHAARAVAAEMAANSPTSFDGDRA